MRVHIEGFGITGCLLARTLEYLGVNFTWCDADAPFTAWKASTGAIYPAGDPASDCALGHEGWRYWALSDRFKDPAWLEFGEYRFNHKQPPHGGKYALKERDEFGIAHAMPMSFHFNAQLMVPETRERYAGLRLEGARPKGSQVVVAHGFGERFTHAYWGYTRLVQLEYNRSTGCGSDLRPAFYFREGRFVMAYAYPVAGTPWWYAGSKIIKQKAGKLKSLSMEPKYALWRRDFERLGNGAVQVTREGEFIEGWRPARSDSAWVTRDAQSRILVPPLWNSGIRHFPVVLKGVLNELGLHDPSLDHIKR